MTDCEIEGGFFCSDKCLYYFEKCNFLPDCDDALDEMTTCPEHRIFKSPNSCRRFIEKEENKNCLVNYDSLGNPFKYLHEPFMRKCKARNCRQGSYKCIYSHYCIDISNVCDGVNHCLHGDDEFNCGKSITKYLIKYLPMNYVIGNFNPYGMLKCKHDRKYINHSLICDDILDCLDGSDELFCKIPKYCPNSCSCFPNYKINCSNAIISNFNEFFLRKIIIINNGKININQTHSSYKNYETIFIKINDIVNNLWRFLNIFMNIHFLDLSKNNITHFDSIQSNINSEFLMNLSLNDNPLKKFSVNKSFPSLIFLNLSNTNIIDIQKNSFKYLKNLKIYLFKYNNLHKLHEQSFYNLKSLIEINFNQTKFVNKMNIILSFKNLHSNINLKKFISNQYRICCLFEKNTQIDCYPKLSNKNKCFKLIYSNIFNYFIIFKLLLICLIIPLFIYSLKQIKKFKFYLKLVLNENLQLFYFIIILIINNKYENSFYLYEFKHLKSPFCFLLILLSTTFSILIFQIILFTFLKNKLYFFNKKYLQILFYIIQFLKYIFLFFDFFYVSSYSIFFFCNIRTFFSFPLLFFS